MPAPTTQVQDSFNRANESPLANGSWAALRGEALGAIVSNVLQLVWGGTTKKYSAKWSPTTFSGVQEVFCDVTVVGTPWIEIWLCASGAEESKASGYSWEWETGKYKILKTTNGAKTTLAEVAGELVSGDGLWFHRDTEGHLVGYRRHEGTWTETLTATDTTFTTGAIGWAIRASSATAWEIDNFGGGEPGKFNLFLKEVTSNTWTTSGGTAIECIGKTVPEAGTPPTTKFLTASEAGKLVEANLTLPEALVTMLNAGGKVIGATCHVRGENTSTSGLNCKFGFVSPAVNSTPEWIKTTPAWKTVSLSKAQAEELTKKKLEELKLFAEHLTPKEFHLFEIYLSIEVQEASGKVVTVTATLAGAGALTPSSVRSAAAAPKLAGNGRIAPSAAKVGPTTPLLTGAGALRPSAAKATPTAALLTGAGVLTSSAARAVPVTTLLRGAGLLITTSGRVRTSSGILVGRGVLIPSQRGLYVAAPVLRGAGLLIPSLPGGKVVQVTAVLAGRGVITPTALRAAVATPKLAGGGVLQPSVVRARPVAPALAGRGIITPAVLRIVTVAPALAGAGRLRPELLRVAAVAAHLAGLGELSVEIATPIVVTDPGEVLIELEALAGAQLTVTEIDGVALVVVEAAAAVQLAVAPERRTAQVEIVRITDATVSVNLP